MKNKDHKYTFSCVYYSDEGETNDQLDGIEVKRPSEHEARRDILADFHSRGLNVRQITLVQVDGVVVPFNS